MLKRITFSVLFACLLYSEAAHAATITFNENPLGTIVDDEYLSNGLFFTTSGSDPATIVDITPDGNTPSSSVVSAPSGPNGLRVISNTFDDILTVMFHPTGVLADTGTVSEFSFEFVSDAATTSTEDNGTLRAFNSGGVLLAETLSIVGGTRGDQVQGLETLLVVAPNIAWVEISGFADVIIDSANYEFSSTTTPVPLPATLPLLAGGLGLIGLLGWRRRRAAV